MMSSFKVFRLAVGVLVALVVAWLIWGGLSGISQARGPHGLMVEQLKLPVVELLAGAGMLLVFYMTLVAATRVRRVMENIFAIPELVKKLAFTVGLLALYRVGFWIPLPGLDQQVIADLMSRQRGTALGQVLETVAIFTGGHLQQSTLFGLGIMPYITASIIFQLLGTVVPAIERLQREGEAGRRKIQEYTRYLTVLLCIIQGSFWMSQLFRGGGVYPEHHGMLTFLIGVVGMTAGSVFLMWLGEQIDEYGIGNGISLLIMAGIVARMPGAILRLVEQATLDFAATGTGEIGPLKMVMLAGLFVFVTAGSILITQGQRRIPIQQAKHTRGRRVYGGQRHYLPLRVNHGGVMPIIFASSLMLLPRVVFSTVSGWWPTSAVAGFLARQFEYGAYLFVTCEIALIFFFAYFWTTVMFRPKEMAEQLRDMGHFIPGLRPGRRTAEYLERVMERITYCGAAFLALIAVLPALVANWMGVDQSIAVFLGGTGLLITVSVTLDLVQRIEAQLVMRNYGGFLGEGARIRGAYS